MSAVGSRDRQPGQDDGSCTTEKRGTWISVDCARKMGKGNGLGIWHPREQGEIHAYVLPGDDRHSNSALSTFLYTLCTLDRAGWLRNGPNSIGKARSPCSYSDSRTVHSTFPEVRQHGVDTGLRTPARTIWGWLQHVGVLGLVASKYRRPPIPAWREVDQSWQTHIDCVSWPTGLTGR